MAKAKLINSNGDKKSNPVGKWYKHDQIKPFIQGIVTHDIDVDQVSSTLISGVPTPWARAKMFWFAFDYLTKPDPNIRTSGLIDFYKVLVEEWKGLIALIALYKGRISFSQPILLNPNRDFFSITGDLGRMLLNDREFWTDLQANQTSSNELPFIQLIKYNDQVIGACSPYSIFFPGVNYSKLSSAGDIDWYKKGKFEDPTKYLDNDKLQKLYLFLRNIENNYLAYETKINSGTNKLNLTGLISTIRKWIESIEEKAKSNNYKLQNKGIVAKYENLKNPYKDLLHSEIKVYLTKRGDLTFDNPSNQNDLKEELSDLQNILKKGGPVLGWFESPDLNNPLSESAVYYLKVKDFKNPQQPFKYFSLPLSLEGVKMFSGQIGKLLNGKNKDFKLEGKISDDGKKLIIDLTVKIFNGIEPGPYSLTQEEYEIVWEKENKKVIMWPDFISKYWDAYYLYTEYPLNDQPTRFVPFYKDCITDRLITENVGDEDLVVFGEFDERGSSKSQTLKLDKIVSYPYGKVGDLHKYEVIKSDKPIAGLEIMLVSADSSQNAGYLIVKNPGEEFGKDRKKIVNFSTEVFNVFASIGIDFGSNNTSVHYRTSETEVLKPIEFKNRRLALVGMDAKAGTVAQYDELLFFSNESTSNGQIKSWLHEHDTRFVENMRDSEIAGGVAVNERNIKVNEMDQKIIKTQAGILNYNMKWYSDVEGERKKKAFLQGIWLSICADLYSEKILPAEIYWSFPSSMSAKDVGQLQNIYTITLPKLTPINLEIGGRLKLQNETTSNENDRLRIGETESEAVCKFALNGYLGLSPNKIFAGLDIGGSTTDVLIIGNAIKEGQIVNRLYKQSSVRLAAGVFFNAVVNSTSFRKTIYSFHENYSRLLKIENIADILVEGRKAPYYLNCVFDSLKDEDFSIFYSYIRQEASFVFSIPAFVTGLLTYYTGKLTAKTIQENELLGIDHVTIYPFGKGGRLFYWLENLSVNSYLEECFRAGFGEANSMIKTIELARDVKKFNKSEVSMGLASNQKIDFDIKMRDKSDIYCEKNISRYMNGQEISIEENDIVLNEHFRNNQFKFPPKLENFEAFHKIFIEFIGNKSGLVRNTQILDEKSKELPQHLKSFIDRDTEYIKAQNSTANEYQFRFPIFILEGLCYLERILIPELFKS